MKAVILAGGRGKRLKPITDYVPKPLIPLNNVPIIEWQIRYLKKYGINEFIICTGYRTEQIKNFLDTKNNLQVKIRFSEEKTPLGTGGAIKKLRKWIKNESFIVINGDVITNININKLKSKTNTIASIQLKTKFGILDVKDNKIINFSEKKQVENLWMNAGIYHFSDKIFKDLPSKGDIEKTTFPKYAKEQKLNITKFENVEWYSIDSFKDMEDCSGRIKKIIKN
ncbi:MAG: nucleotidyltransferase family protein [Crenarchaeota archaeon]|nr:MAG: nucleotidyltransferase family protein [Thermoproteota archaeon]RDJ34146.1 MAG: nucleotidyltransferase family protein [Thermoproteota archaeon]RDJ36738.1 MAG: nucleotidyltransferase family protein [Thermoproteota archaeon]RDJ37728.1 MAG: nucleotidyltransferase family protein [Thermoproteota archaeon]